MEDESSKWQAVGRWFESDCRLDLSPPSDEGKNAL